MIFVDTGAFLARYLDVDQYHQTATALWGKIVDVGEACCTSNFVFDETATFLARRAGYRFAAERTRQFYSSGELLILRPTLEDELTAIEMFEKYADQQISFTDCISFVLMRKAGLNTVFSFDQHFVFAGFKLWS
ncbi:MAG: PIN domain-containing protein [Verrucomicrobia bacterium]|nr:PIN domain-containing protein [Verrucomicrobiota bacterium]